MDVVEAEVDAGVIAEERVAATARLSRYVTLASQI